MNVVMGVVIITKGWVMGVVIITKEWAMGVVNVTKKWVIGGRYFSQPNLRAWKNRPRISFPYEMIYFPSIFSKF